MLASISVSIIYKLNKVRKKNKCAETYYSTYIKRIHNVVHVENQTAAITMKYTKEKRVSETKLNLKYGILRASLFHLLLSTMTTIACATEYNAYNTNR